MMRSTIDRRYFGRRGMTIIEMSVTLALLISLAGVITFSLGGYGDWKLGKEASGALQSVYLAQKSLLADRPTIRLIDLTAADLVPYLPGGATEIPKVEALDGGSLDIDYNIMPPKIVGGYDPSPSEDDGVWDVGRL
ncbi:MAG: prepilin-type N-terminal cleavage/methylation domain-containing protein [Verrucomicrobiales bacterium]|jgi:prepilin-type N-terminal cleavage/methylation domain-containing protein